MYKHTKKGFTLIELLVVIAIIALLVSILLPSLKVAKDMAKSSVCLSNVKGIGTATAMYAYEYDGVYSVYGVQQLNLLVAGLVGDTQSNILDCPARPGVVPGDRMDKFWVPYSDTVLGEYVYCGYGYNAPEGWERTADNLFPVTTIDRFRHPSAVVQWCDSEAYYMLLPTHVDPNLESWTEAGGYRRTVYPHLERISLGFYDGHAESMARYDTSTEMWHNPKDWERPGEW